MSIQGARDGVGGGVRGVAVAERSESRGRAAFEVVCACGAHVCSGAPDDAARAYIWHAYSVHRRSVSVSDARALVRRVHSASTAVTPQAPEPHERSAAEVYRLDEGRY
ncbi:MAG TPA: hypothetical protein VEZ44_08805 [bacterium]|nr:hypothetical protein [bacterium]